MATNGFDVWHELATNLRGLPQIPTRAEIEGIFGQSQVLLTSLASIRETFESRSVLVTGAAGSIGSELCRQLADLNVARLLLLDHSENSLFEFENEMHEHTLDTEIVHILGDVRDRQLLDDLFDRYGPQIVLHSAAYKHVPMMEAHPCEAFLNNVVGTRNALDSALESGCERFVLISTDKAVNPSSVMGATKRLGEMLVRSQAGRFPTTSLASVRFGNVIGSRGSVIPIFLKQIAERKPITLTDERMTRYFISITDAVQLVLQASTLSSRGEVYVMTMGDPIMIKSVAEKLIALSSLDSQDIPIQIIGARPGEKLREELWSESSCVTKTDLPGILRIVEGETSAGLEDQLDELEELAKARLGDDLCEKLCALGYYDQDRFAPSTVRK